MDGFIYSKKLYDKELSSEWVKKTKEKNKKKK